MQRITKYIPNNNGSYTAVVEGLELGNDETLMLENGISVPVDVNVHNPYRISSKQRKKIFALVNDIEAHTGQPRDYMRYMFQDYVQLIHGYEEPVSLSNCSKQTAGQIIDVIIEWVFLHHIPLNYRTSDLMREDNRFLYLATVNRQCVICGKPNAHLAHYYAVGRGRNRNTIDHFGNYTLGLCSNHHGEQHQIGIDSFNEKYHLINSWIKVDDRLNRLLKGQKERAE